MVQSFGVIIIFVFSYACAAEGFYMFLILFDKFINSYLLAVKSDTMRSTDRLIAKWACPYSYHAWIYAK